MRLSREGQQLVFDGITDRLARHRRVLWFSFPCLQNDDRLALEATIPPCRRHIAKLDLLDRCWDDASRDDGVRNAVVRKAAERDLTTTVLTLTITGIAADSSLAGGTNPGWSRRALSVALMFAGAAAGAWLLRYSVALPIAISGIISGLCGLVSRSRSAAQPRGSAAGL